MEEFCRETAIDILPNEGYGAARAVFFAPVFYRPDPNTSPEFCAIVRLHILILLQGLYPWDQGRIFSALHPAKLRYTLFRILFETESAVPVPGYFPRRRYLATEPQWAVTSIVGDCPLWLCGNMNTVQRIDSTVETALLQFPAESRIVSEICTLDERL